MTATPAPQVRCSNAPPAPSSVPEPHQAKEHPTATHDRYDPHNEAAIWQQASNLVASLKTHDPNAWNTALDQAFRLLERHATESRQRNGMYYRPLTDSSH